MNPWLLLDRAATPGNGEELRLYQRDTEFSIMAGKYELMNSRLYGSEDALGKLACRKITHQPRPRILIGGLGMGYTIRSALDELGDQAQIIVSELVPAVVRWNRECLSHLAGRPLEDPRVTLLETDVAELIKRARGEYDAILLDVDNGPEGLTREDNNWLYSPEGLAAAAAALRPKGALAIWSAGPDAAFVKRLRQTGFKVEEYRVRGHQGAKGRGHYTVWTAVLD